jgi:Galactose oxidase, central domain
MFYDEKRKSIILFGGVDESGVLGDTWELNLQEDWARFEVTPTTQP